MAKLSLVLTLYFLVNVAGLYIVKPGLFFEPESILREVPIFPSILLLFVPLFAAAKLAQLLDALSRMLKEIRSLRSNVASVSEKANELGDIDIQRLREKLGADRLDPGGITHRLCDDLIHMFEHRNAQPIYMIVDRYSQPFGARLIQIAQYRSAALYIGILFTFIGMTMAILSLEQGGFSRIQRDELLSVVSGLQMAFLSSISGLLAALFILWMLLPFSTHMSRVFDEMEHLVRGMFSMFSRLELSPSVVGSLGEVAGELRLAKSELSSGNARTAELIQTINDGLKALPQVKVDFEALIADLHESQQNLLEKMRDGFDEFAPEELAKNLSKSVEQSLNAYGSELDETRSTFREMSDAARTLTSSLQFVERRIEEMAQKSDQASQAVSSNMNEMMATLKRVADASEEIAGYHPVQTFLRRIRGWIDGGGPTRRP